MPEAINLPEAIDCRKCGACCRAFVGAVAVDQHDVTPRHLTRSVRRAIGFGSWEADEGIRRMAQKDGNCIAFRGEVGAACRCAIYERRPAACRDFEPGGEACLAARKRDA